MNMNDICRDVEIVYQYYSTFSEKREKVSLRVSKTFLGIDCDCSENAVGLPLNAFFFEARKYNPIA